MSVKWWIESSVICDLERLIMKIHHIGYLVKNINEAINEFERIGYIIEQDVIYDEYRKIHIAFIIKDGYRIELVASASDDSVVSGVYKRVKNSPYHICYESSSFDEDVKRLLETGVYLQIDKPMPAPALNNHRVTFLMNVHFGLVEVFEIEQNN